ncbi:hypothetical protein RJZ56_006113 [Blastomyces dermatitidis]
MENLSLHDHNNGGHGARRGGGPPPLPHGHRGYHPQPNPPPHSGFPHHHQVPPGAPPPAPGQAPSPGPMMPPAPPQLPPQMFTTAAQLLDLTDSEQRPSLRGQPWKKNRIELPFFRQRMEIEKLVLVLRDGRKLIGVLRSWDQFANLVLQGTVERLYAGNLFADIQRGIYLIRGENVLLLGEVVRLRTIRPKTKLGPPQPSGTLLTGSIVQIQDLDKEDDIPTGYRQAPFEEVFALKKQEDNERKKGDKRRNTKLQTLGFEAEHSGEVLF